MEEDESQSPAPCIRLASQCTLRGMFPAPVLLPLLYCLRRLSLFLGRWRALGHPAWNPGSGQEDVLPGLRAEGPSHPLARLPTSFQGESSDSWLRFSRKSVALLQTMVLPALCKLAEHMNVSRCRAVFTTSQNHMLQAKLLF